jgi:hypothetical protein
MLPTSTPPCNRTQIRQPLAIAITAHRDRESREPAPERKIRTADDYRALHARLPEKFLWGTGEQIESIVKPDTGGFVNVGTLDLDDMADLIKISTNSEQRLGTLIGLVRSHAPSARELSRKVQAAEELAGPPKRDHRTNSRDRVVQRRHGFQPARPEPRKIIYETYFLPLDFEDSGLANRISRVTIAENMLATASIDGMTPAQALAAGGAPRLEALALIDDCEWSRRRKAEDGQDVTYRDARPRRTAPGTRASSLTTLLATSADV